MQWAGVTWPLSEQCLVTMADTEITEHLRITEERRIFSPRRNSRSWNLEIKNRLFPPQVEHSFLVGFCALAWKSASKPRGCLG